MLRSLILQYYKESNVAHVLQILFILEEIRYEKIPEFITEHKNKIHKKPFIKVQNFCGNEECTTLLNYRLNLLHWVK